MSSRFQLTVSDVLKRPLFQHAECIAGKRGLSKSIRWVHILESAETAAFLNGGEFILATGVGFGLDHDKRLAYLRSLIERKAVGLGIELGSFITDIPQDMIQIADHYEFPLIVFHQPVRYVDITLDLHECIVSQHTQMLRRIEAYSREMQQLSLQINSLPRLLEHFQSVVQTQAFYYPLDGTALFAPAMAQSVQQEFLALFQRQLDSEALPLHSGGAIHLSEKKQVLCQPVKAMEHVLAYAGVIVYDDVPDEFVSLTLNYTVTAIAQILLRRMFAEERLYAEQGKILDDILQGKMTHEEQLRHALDVHVGQQAVKCLALIIQNESLPAYNEKEGGQQVHDLVAIVRSICSRHSLRCYLMNRGNRIYLLLLLTDKRLDMRQQVKKALREIQNLYQKSLGKTADFRFGASRVTNRLQNIRQCFQEAEQILDKRAFLPSSHFDELGVHQLLIQMQDHTALVLFVNDFLGPLIDHDKAYGSELVKTLRVFLDHHGSKQEAAEQLYIRRQSLYHRLQKIEGLIGPDFLSAEQRISLEVALRAYEWLQKKDIP